MITQPNMTRIWGIAIALVTFGTLCSSILATTMLDAFLKGPGPSSVTTRVPGFVYASATVMKVMLVAGLVMIVMALGHRMWAAAFGSALGTSVPAESGVPYWGITSVVAAPLSPVTGATVLTLAQVLARTPQPLTMTDMSRFSQTAVIVMLIVLIGGAVAAFASLAKGERPMSLPILGVIVNGVLSGLFWHFEFYAVGFDQDKWAPR